MQDLPRVVPVGRLSSVVRSVGPSPSLLPGSSYSSSTTSLRRLALTMFDRVFIAGTWGLVADPRVWLLIVNPRIATSVVRASSASRWFNLLKPWKTPPRDRGLP